MKLNKECKNQGYYIPDQFRYRLLEGCTFLRNSDSGGASRNMVEFSMPNRGIYLGYTLYDTTATPTLSPYWETASARDRIVWMKDGIVPYKDFAEQLLIQDMLGLGVAGGLNAVVPIGTLIDWSNALLEVGTYRVNCANTNDDDYPANILIAQVMILEYVEQRP